VKLGEAKTALVAKEWLPLDRVAHTIKGNALAAGDEEMAETAIALRSAANLKDDVAAAELVSKLEELSTLL
jgi:HPt (histidine-containing phosphotransfer) domain-containing protein